MAVLAPQELVGLKSGLWCVLHLGIHLCFRTCLLKVTFKKIKFNMCNSEFLINIFLKHVYVLCRYSYVGWSNWYKDKFKPTKRSWIPVGSRKTNIRLYSGLKTYSPVKWFYLLSGKNCNLILCSLYSSLSNMLYWTFTLLVSLQSSYHNRVIVTLLDQKGEDTIRLGHHSVLKPESNSLFFNYFSLSGLQKCTACEFRDSIKLSWSITFHEFE